MCGQRGTVVDTWDLWCVHWKWSTCMYDKENETLTLPWVILFIPHGETREESLLGQGSDSLNKLTDSLCSVTHLPAHTEDRGMVLVHIVLCWKWYYVTHSITTLMNCMRWTIQWTNLLNKSFWWTDSRDSVLSKELWFPSLMFHAQLMRNDKWRTR